MVVFCCNGCGESVNKPKVEKHRQRCKKSHSLDCHDCHTTFLGDEFQTHTSCVTEAQRYGGKDYEHKVPKGQAKQDSWVQQVHSAIENCDPSDTQLKGILGRLSSYTNIPRKQKPFVNFLKNSFNLNRTPDVAERAWTLIQSATGRPTAGEQQQQGKSGEAAAAAQEQQSKPEKGKKRKQEAEEEVDQPQLNGSTTAAATAEPPAKKKKKKDKKAKAAAVAAESVVVVAPATTATTENGSVAATEIDSKFKWKSTIKTALTANPNHKMKLKKLNAAVLKVYREAHQTAVGNEDELRAAVLEKLQAMKEVELDGKLVVLKDTTAN